MGPDGGRLECGGGGGQLDASRGLLPRSPRLTRLHRATPPVRRSALALPARAIGIGGPPARGRVREPVEEPRPEWLRSGSPARRGRRPAGAAATGEELGGFADRRVGRPAGVRDERPVEDTAPPGCRTEPRLVPDDAQRRGHRLVVHFTSTGSKGNRHLPRLVADDPVALVAERAALA